MKLSEAMEKGCKGRQQSRSVFFYRSETGSECCAMGAVMLSFLRPEPVLYNDSMWNAAVKKWPELESLVSFHGKEYVLSEVIMQMNDDYCCSFEEIIQFLQKEGF